MNGKTIKIYLVDGTPSSTMIAEIINWTGQAIVTPRTNLAELSKRTEVKRTGIYILAGEDPNNPTKELIYIGESDNVFRRLSEHNQDEKNDFWSKTIIFVSKDENLTKAHIRYLESRLINIATEAKRAKIANAANPTPNALPESDIADMEFFLTQAEMLLPVLGFTFALPVPTTIIYDDVEASPIFTLNAPGGVDAKVQTINGVFVVLKDSKARKNSVESLQKTYKVRREQLVAEGTLKDTGADYYLVTENFTCDTISLATGVVSGNTMPGRASWKVSGTSKTYSEWENDKIKEVKDTNESPDESNESPDESNNFSTTQ